MHRSGQIGNDAKHGLDREIAIARASFAVRVSASTAVGPLTNLTWVNNFTIVNCNQLYYSKSVLFIFHIFLGIFCNAKFASTK